MTTIQVARYSLLRRSLYPTVLVRKGRPSLTATIRSQSGGTGESSKEPPVVIGTNGVKLDTSFLARQFINTLDANERRIIKDELIRAEAEAQTQIGPGKDVRYYLIIIYIWIYI